MIGIFQQLKHLRALYPESGQIPFSIEGLLNEAINIRQDRQQTEQIDIITDKYGEKFIRIACSFGLFLLSDPSRKRTLKWRRRAISQLHRMNQ